MSLIIAFVTGATAVLETITHKRAALLPNEIRANGFAALDGIEPVVTAFDTNRSKNLNDLLQWLDWRNASGVILLADDSLPDLVAYLGDQFNVHRFTPPAYGTRMDNQLTSTLSKCLKAYKYLASRFADAKYQQIFRLPLRNFDAPDIARMRELCRDMTQRNYGNEIDALLRDMRKRQAPKRASDYQDIYYVDDSGKHFQFGHEHHALADTAMPPHNALCIIGNCLRFGQRFDGTTHYNVSRDKGASMKGTYLDCHGSCRLHQKHSHINMFTNNFF
ncbi:hypothetical protein LV564_00020 (plasmid) [Komagataeibacter nataicola]|uniref:hypothetical protein n=1 Tax=Komagataeibacter nataicola TaxID=265960 RepID=UPI0023DD015F|nr:hypothetical protein [Komagataeibacter nataicola]WEQ54207.1 hypothetical protein LV564_00020 [Komagataeibacter nataicola]